MTFDPSFGNLVNAISGLLLIGLGLTVGLVKPRTGVRQAFGWFSALFGTWYVVINTTHAFGLEGAQRDPYVVVQTLAFLGAATSLVVFGVLYARSLGLRGLGRVYRPWIVAAVVSAPALFVLDPAVRAALYLPAFTGPATVGLFFAVGPVMIAALWGVLHLLQAAYAGTDMEPRRTEVALVSSSLALYPCVYLGDLLISLVVPLGGRYWTLYAAAMAIAAAWLWMAWFLYAVQARDRTAHRVALVVLAAASAGTLTAAFLPGFGGGIGIARTLGVVVLGYALVRHQALGLDVKIKWTLKHSTVAAIFLSVIFLVSEGAQIAFGEDQAWLGLFAGGVLVFALSPLQRFAEGLSNKAMPHVQGSEAYRSRRAREIYQAAVESALVDGTVTEKERDMLATLADQVGLSAGEARAIEREAAGSGAG